jgi:autotransporter-associated beta strand protein
MGNSTGTAGLTKTLDTSGAGLLKFTSTFTGSAGATNDITLTGSSNGEITGGQPFTFRDLSKAGNGTWTLSGTVGHTSTTTITAGKLALGASNVLSNATAVFIASATLDTATFVTAADFGNAGAAAGTIGTITETAPGVFTVQVIPNTTDSLQLRINAGAVLSDVVGNALNTSSAILDDTAITVMPLNSAPVAIDQSVAADEDTALSITLVGTDADLDVLSYTIVCTPTSGTVESAAATVSLTITPVNDAPVFVANPITGSDATEDTAYSGTLAASASDVDASATLTYAPHG